MKIKTNNLHETLDLGKKFAKKIHGGEVFVLHGDLGAGKTAFVKGVAKGLGIKKTVTSPTFILMKMYEVKGKDESKKLKGQLKKLLHIDTYRGVSEDDLINLGAMELLGRKDTVAFIEWGIGLIPYLKKSKIKVKKIIIKNIDKNTRVFEF